MSRGCGRCKWCSILAIEGTIAVQWCDRGGGNEGQGAGDGVCRGVGKDGGAPTSLTQCSGKQGSSSTRAHRPRHTASRTLRGGRVAKNALLKMWRRGMRQGVSMVTRGNTNRGGREGRDGDAFGLGLGGCGQAPANLCVGVGIEAMRASPSPLCVRGEITSICCLIRYAYIGWNVCHHSNKPTQTHQTKSKQGGSVCAVTLPFHNIHIQRSPCL